jgi:hypothetical protein
VFNRAQCKSEAAERSLNVGELVELRVARSLLPRMCMRSLVHPHIGRNANVTIAITTAEPIRYRDETKIVRARVLRLY